MCVGWLGTGGAGVEEWARESRSERSESRKMRDRREGELEDHG